MAGGGQHTVSLDDAIEACRTTAMDMHMHCESGPDLSASLVGRLTMCRQGDQPGGSSSEFRPHSRDLR
jgi:hypothetical protein